MPLILGWYRSPAFSPSRFYWCHRRSVVKLVLGKVMRFRSEVHQVERILDRSFLRDKRMVIEKKTSQKNCMKPPTKASQTST